MTSMKVSCSSVDGLASAFLIKKISGNPGYPKHFPLPKKTDAADPVVLMSIF